VLADVVDDQTGVTRLNGLATCDRMKPSRDASTRRALLKEVLIWSEEADDCEAERPRSTVWRIGHGES
jgi:hypothetical protein